MEIFENEIVLLVLGILYMLVEYFLGKTNLVKAGSALELILNGVKKVLEGIGVKKPKL